MKIAVGNSRMDKKWKNTDISWEDFCSRVRSTQKTTETVEEYRKLKKAQQDEIKDVGGFVGGHISGGRRKKGNILCRSMLTLDMDYGTPDIWEQITMFFDFRCCIYSTHKHTPAKPRLRLIIPMSREVSEEEYAAVGRMAAKEIGIDLFDDTTYEAHRLMYWPSTSSNGVFVYEEMDGNLFDPDVYLSKYDDWRDTSTWTVSSRQSEIIKRTLKEQADPLTKEGVVGTFCRTYGICEAIEKFLSDVYAPSAMEGRYDYIPADSSAGMVVYDDKFAYSHHATDPASGHLLNAFDLVRIHKFGDENEKASFKAMNDFAVADEKVKVQFAEERRSQASTEFTDESDWQTALELDKSGAVKNTLRNITLIIENDPELKSLVFNQLADGMEIKGEVPWKHPARFWRDADDAQLISYVDNRYGTFSARNYEIAITKVTDDRSYHPIREYLDSLPPWDNVQRLDTLYIDYLGAEDNTYTRAVTRKSHVAAVARVKQPGIKFDSIPVLNGNQGIGKSTLIAQLGREWYSDSLNIADMKDKTAAEKLQGNWLLEIGEMAGIKKMDVETVKSFASRTDDKYRASFGRRVTSHPRQCVLFGTTNNEGGFLRDITGNRRFWPVKVTGDGRYKPWDLTSEVVDQIWAEAIVYYEAGEKLYLNRELEVLARTEQKNAMECDEREGLVQEYLDTLIPENWENMPVYDRRNYIADPDDPTTTKGMVERDTVCNLEIWCECFGKRKEDMTPRDSYAIAAIMLRTEGWEKSGEWVVRKPYGRQRVYVRR